MKRRTVPEMYCDSIDDFSVSAYQQVIASVGLLLAHFKQPIDLLGLVCGLGRPHDHNSKEAYVWDIKPGKEQGAPARSLTAQSFPLHTDCCFENPPPAYLAMQVIKEDRFGGGRSLFVDFHEVDNVLSSEAKEVLLEEYTFSVPKEFLKKEAFFKGPILFEERKIRYRRECIVETRCSARQKKAIDALDEAINDSELVFPHFLQTGSVIFLDNTRYLHGRTDVKDPERHLKRIRYF